MLNALQKRVFNFFSKILFELIRMVEIICALYQLKDIVARRSNVKNFTCDLPSKKLWGLENCPFFFAIINVRCIPFLLFEASHLVLFLKKG